MTLRPAQDPHLPMIYLDMDDVVADWHKAAQAFLKQRWLKDGERIPQADWNRIKDFSHFYLYLPMMQGADELVSRCRRAVLQKQVSGLAFLTALPHDYSMPYAAQDKVWWAHRHWPNIPVFFGPFSQDKWRHCSPGDILIDDRTLNCEEWRERGGQAHVYRTWAACEPWLEQHIGVDSA